MDKVKKPKKPPTPSYDEEEDEEFEEEEEPEEKVASYGKKMYDPLEYGSESEEQQMRVKKKNKNINKKRKSEVGYGGKRYVYYEDRSEYSDDLDEAGFDDIEEEEYVSGMIGNREDEEEL